jgi:uncharacterized protein (DUF58 family)
MAASSVAIPPRWEAALKRWINFHHMLWALTAISLFIAWNRGLALLYGLFSMLAALLLISYVMPGRQLRNIRVMRRSPRDFTVGRPGDITYYLTTAGTRYHVELAESLEFAETPEQRFFFNKIYKYTTCKLRFRCRQRGCYRLGELRLVSAYPFGIVPFTRRIAVEPLEILVFPRVFELSRLPDPLMADVSFSGDLCRPQKGGRDEYTAIREYHPGDDLNRIHWPVSARHQNLMVREYERTSRPQLLIVLDGSRKFNVGRGPEATFEFAVSIAASMVRRANQDGISCSVAAGSDRWLELTVPSQCKDLYALYEFLARLNGSSRHPYLPTVRRAQQRFPQAGLITTFRLDADPPLMDIAPQATHIDIEMNAHSFRFPGDPTGEPQPLLHKGNRWTYRVCAGDKLENIFL